MDDFSDIEASAHHQFKDGEYFLSMATQNSKTLKIHVEDIATGEQWNGNFDSSCKLIACLVDLFFVFCLCNKNLFSIYSISVL